MNPANRRGKRKQSQPILLRVEPYQYRAFKAAAQVEGRSMNNFIAHAAEAEARNALRRYSSKGDDPLAEFILPGEE